MGKLRLARGLLCRNPAARLEQQQRQGLWNHEWSRSQLIALVSQEIEKPANAADQIV
jgi:hypothetical protein